MTKVTIYCDGACLGNPGPGGYAALLLLPEKNLEKIISGSEQATTNNRMELKAAIEGLRALKKTCQVTIYCDSQYVIRGITEWVFSWQKNNFKNIKNKDLWLDLIKVVSEHSVKWHWVKGHSGNEFNERVDAIAKEEAGLAFHKSVTGHE